LIFNQHVVFRAATCYQQNKLLSAPHSTVKILFYEYILQLLSCRSAISLVLVDLQSKWWLSESWRKPFTTALLCITIGREPKERCHLGHWNWVLQFLVRYFCCLLNFQFLCKLICSKPWTTNMKKLKNVHLQRSTCC